MEQFRCHSVSLLAAEKQRDPAQLEYSDKIIMPSSCLEKLAHLEISYPMIFEVTNPRYLARRLHCARRGMHHLVSFMRASLPPRSCLVFPRPGRVPLDTSPRLPFRSWPLAAVCCMRSSQVACSNSSRRRAWCTCPTG